MGALLGLLQGLTEFLPVSSSGHLVAAQDLLGLPQQGVALQLTVHMATLLAVLLVYRGTVRELALGVWQAARGQEADAFGVPRAGPVGDPVHYLVLLVMGTVPAAVAGLALAPLIREAFASPGVVPVGWGVTGVVLFSLRERVVGRNEGVRTPWRATLIGLAQAVAILPGVSRSGLTVAAAIWLGIRKSEAARFSFLLAVPLILGAGMVGGMESLGQGGFDLDLVPTYGLAFLAALGSGVLAIRLFLRVLMAQRFHRFAYYCWAISLAYGLSLLQG